MARGSTVARSFSAAAARPSPRGAPAPLPPSNAPTLGYRRHHDVLAPQVDGTAFRPGWLTQTRLAALHTAGRIDREALDAACRWRDWFETVTPFRAQPWEVRVDASLTATDAGMLLRVNAASQLRAGADALGPLRVRLLEAVAVKDLSWLELGRILRCSDKTAQAFGIEAIEALADWRAGRTVAAPPVLRFRNQPGSL